MADTYTTEQLARAFKEKYPQYASVPDAQLAAAIVEKYPQYRTGLAGQAPSAPSTPKELAPPANLYERIGQRIGSNVRATDPITTADYISQLLKSIENPPYPQGGGLAAIGQELKSTYSRPENIIGDLVSAYLLNAGEGGPGPKDVIEGVGKGAKGAVEGAIATPLQRLAGAGPEPVLLELMAREEAIAKGQAKYRQQLAEANEASRAAYQQSRYGEDLKQNLDQTYNRVKGKLDARWDQLRKTPTKSGGGLSILNDELGNAKELRDGVDIAERKFLQGSPDSIRQFRDLTGWIERGGGEVGGEAGGARGRLTPPTWDEMRTHYTAMGDAMYNREIPSNVYRALKYMREEVLGKQLQSMAQKAGVGDQYETLLRDHSRFEDDWNNTSSVSRGGGSPLAIARKAPNAATLIPQVTGKTGDLLIQRLAKYQDAGASPATAEAIRRAGSTLKVPERPTAPQTPAEVDPAAIRRERILQFTSRPKTWYDFAPWRLASKKVLQNPFMREFVATYPRNEYPVPKGARAADILGRMPSPTESFEDVATRRGPGEAPSARNLNEQRTLVQNMRMRYDQMRAAHDPAMWAQGMKLRDAEEALKAMEKAQWSSALNVQQHADAFKQAGGDPARAAAIQNPPGSGKTATSILQNMTPEQLAEFKKRYNIQ